MASPENNCKHVRSIKVEYSVKKPEIAGSTLKIIALVTMLIPYSGYTSTGTYKGWHRRKSAHRCILGHAVSRPHGLSYLLFPVSGRL